jgi:hypothetical protein
VRTPINATPTEKQEKPLHDRLAARTRPSPDPRPTNTVKSRRQPAGRSSSPPSGRTWATGHTIPCTTTSVTTVATE